MNLLLTLVAWAAVVAAFLLYRRRYVVRYLVLAHKDERISFPVSSVFRRTWWGAVTGRRSAEVNVAPIYFPVPNDAECDTVLVGDVRGRMIYTVPWDEFERADQRR